MIELVERAGTPLIKRGSFHTLAHWLDILPVSLVSSRPALISLRGAVSIMGGEVSQSLSLFNQAAEEFRRNGDRLCLCRTLARRATAYHFLGDYWHSVTDAEEILNLTGQDVDFIVLRAEALKQRGASLNALGQPNRAIRDIKASLGLYESMKDRQNIANLLQELGIIYRNIGEYEAAKTAYNKAYAYWHSVGDHFRLAGLLNCIGNLYHSIGEYVQAVSSFDEAYRLSCKTGYERMQAFILASAADLFMDLHIHLTAQDYYSKAFTFARRIDNRFLLFYILWAQAILEREKGDLERARQWIAQSQEYTQADSRYEQGLIALEKGRIAYKLGDREAAQQDLEEALSFFQRTNLPVEESITNLWLAQNRFTAGDKEKALPYLEKAFQRIKTAKTIRPLIVQGCEMVDLLIYARGQTGLRYAATELMEGIKQFKEQLPGLRRKVREEVCEVRLIQPQMVVQALGVMQVAIDGRVLAGGDWKSPLQKELFFYILQHQDGVSRTDVEAQFWHDSDRLKRPLENALYKLRRLLGGDVIIYQDDRYHFNRSLDYDYDIERFLGHDDRAHACSDITKSVNAYQEMTSIYRGHFLVDAGGSWVVGERERFWQKYVNAVEFLAGFYLTQGDFHASLDICLPALQLDQSLETVHRLLMRTYAAMGNQTKIHRQYQLVRSVVKDQIGTEPSKQTVQLYRSLVT